MINCAQVLVVSLTGLPLEKLARAIRIAVCPPCNGFGWDKK